MALLVAGLGMALALLGYEFDSDNTFSSGLAVAVVGLVLAGLSGCG